MKTGAGTQKIVLASGTQLPAGVRIVQTTQGQGTPVTGSVQVGQPRVVFLSGATSTATATPTATVIAKPADGTGTPSSGTAIVSSSTDVKTNDVKAKIPQLDGADDEEDETETAKDQVKNEENEDEEMKDDSGNSSEETKSSEERECLVGESSPEKSPTKSIHQQNKSTLESALLGKTAATTGTSASTTSCMIIYLIG